MNNEKQAKRFVSVRLTEEDFNEVYRQCKNSTCRSLTEYVKKVLTKKPVTVKVRNQSQDELLQTMVGIKNRLDQLAARAEGSGVSTLIELREIKSLIGKIAEKWLQ
jgi:hypothetical protein